MFPIRVITNQYAYFLNQLRLGAARRCLAYPVKITRQTRPLANLLLRLNIIRSVKKLEGQLYSLSPSYDRGRLGLRPLKTYTRVDGRLILTKKSIRLLNYLTPHSYYVLDTPKGVMTHKEALRLGLGGKILLILY